MTDFIHKYDCCGCTACANVCSRKAIVMKPDEEGFLYPSINTDICVQCGLCVKVCPVVRYDQHEFPQTEPDVYALHHKDEDVWEKSSSGGAFEALSNYIISQGGCIFGAIYNERWEVVHSMAETREQAKAFRGSKYVQSDLRGIYPQVKRELKKARLVLFSGTPCQCAGLRGYLRKTYPNLFVVDIMCHSVPSPKVFAEYIHFVQKKADSAIESINMKDKTYGWGQQNLRIVFEDGNEWFDTPISNLWYSIFLSKYVARPSCYKCRFTNIFRPSDITLGDYWSIQESHPEFYDKRGVSFLFINSDKGQNLFSNVKRYYVHIRSNLALCSPWNLFHPVEAPAQRDAYWCDFKGKGFRYTSKKYFQYGRLNRWRCLMQQIASKMKFILKRTILCFCKMRG